MKLIKVEVEGFKSFANRTVLTFDGGLVGIVGPNGSGKSNINDAIKWVLGETSVKSLRGDRMEDVIFAGSKTMKPMNKAEVSLTFDNSDHKVALPHDKFTITRILKRGKGANEYYINGEVARLKDIKMIAMESGMSKSSLAIISQGTISDIAQASPEQRRGIFEEAAGISKYKSRKKEALRKLEKVTDGLEKIRTIIRELERQLNPLRRQAKRAKIFIEKRKKLKDIEIGLIVANVAFFDDKFKILNKELEEVISTKEDLYERIDKAEKTIQNKNDQKLRLENETIVLSNKLQNISSKLQFLKMKENEQKQHREMIIKGKINVSSKSRLETMKEELVQLQKELNFYNKFDEETSEKRSEEIKKVANLESSLSKLNLVFEQNRSKLLKTKTRISILKGYQKNKSNLFRGVKTIIENKSTFPGFQGIVAELLDTDKQFKTAIETVLQGFMQYIVMQKAEDAVEAVRFLKKNTAGRASFIPLETINPKFIHKDHLMVLKTQKGFIDIAANLVKTSPKFGILKNFLLGNILVVDAIENAEAISRIIEKRYLITTLDGDLIKPGGIITGGTKIRGKNLLGIEDDIKELENLLPKYVEEDERLSEQYNNLFEEIQQKKAYISELDLELVKNTEKKQMVQSRFLSLKNQYEEEAKEKFTTSSKVIEDSGVLQSEQNLIQTSLKAKKNSLIEINNEISRTTIIKTELEKMLRDITESSSEKMSQKTQAEFIVNSSKKRLSEEYGLTVENAREKYHLEMERDKAEKIVDELRKEIKELGHVNLDSIKSFEEINERYTRYKESEDELFSAQQTILSAIDEMDQIIITRLNETVKMVNKEMNDIFRVMFGGGYAELKYTDPSNLLETGIEVKAQPPGKTIKNLKLFSGGEKALVAITLLFAILKSKPLPLAILDEVEAALDEANVIRYANFLQELKEKTQFIIVTHRVGTMARMDYLFGATMQNKGVTSFYSVELSKAKELVDKH